MGKGLSITAFVISLTSLILLIPAPVGLILGIIALQKAKNDPEAHKGLAIAAIVIGAIFTLVLILAVAFFAVAAPIY